MSLVAYDSHRGSRDWSTPNNIEMSSKKANPRVGIRIQSGGSKRATKLQTAIASEPFFYERSWTERLFCIGTCNKNWRVDYALEYGKKYDDEIDRGCCFRLRRRLCSYGSKLYAVIVAFLFFSFVGLGIPLAMMYDDCLECIRDLPADQLCPMNGTTCWDRVKWNSPGWCDCAAFRDSTIVWWVFLGVLMIFFFNVVATYDVTVGIREKVRDIQKRMGVPQEQDPLMETPEIDE